jgi:hypothetical protein
VRAESRVVDVVERRAVLAPSPRIGAPSACEYGKPQRWRKGRRVQNCSARHRAAAQKDKSHAAEPVSLETAYNAARSRHAEATWPTQLCWFDVLERVIRSVPVAVTGSFKFGLKSIAKAMYAAGLISTVWIDGPTDGLSAMVAAWAAARETAGTGAPLSAHPLMREVARYDEVDCRTIGEILAWLRKNR